MSYYNLCGIGSQHSNISKGKGVHIKITGNTVCKTPIVKVDRNKNVTLNNVLEVVMNKIKPRTNHFKQLFNYLLNWGRVTSEGSQNNVSINHN